MKRLYILTLCSVALASLVFFFKKESPTTIKAGDGLVIPKAWLTNAANSVTPKKDIRPADQTFLTYPEWYLVFSPDEQANYFKHRTASTFPFMSHTAQIWESYAIVNDQIKDNFPPNGGYQLMIWVIGTSASVEYSIKAWYETVAGRVTDTHEPLTEEDQFNARFTQAYVDFIKDRPWYEFDFKGQLKFLWSTTPFFGDHWLRKIERKYILTSELVVKYVYGKLIGLGTDQVYEEALPTTAVLLDNDSLVNLPRYDKFNEAATELAKSGRSFKEIAGNSSAILITILVPADHDITFENTQIIFTQPISSDRRTKRIALTTPVPSLSKLLLEFDARHTVVEHIFDF
ncbi:MAG: hypothetical protein ACOYXT_09690 [Bacteroidota bacterium]